MTSRRLLNVVLMLFVASMACAVPGTGNTLPVTDTPSPKPTKTTRAPTEVVPTNQSPTQEPAATTVPATRAPRPTSTAAPSCGAFKATSDVAWVTLDSSGNVDQQVASYPDGTTVITPYFEYDCVPKPVTLVTTFSYNGKEVFTDKSQLKTTHTKTGFVYPASAKDGSPIKNGDWSVAFYNNKELVASGTVTVGGGGSNTNDNSNSNSNTNSNGNGGDTSQTVTLQGTVTAKVGGKPIKGAVVVVLQPGITYQKFVDDNGNKADIFTLAKSDAQGQYTLNKPLQRNQIYSVAAGATGFRDAFTDSFILKDSDPDPFTLNVQLSQ